MSPRRWLRYARATLGHLVPYLPGQSGDNKRLRAAAPQLVAVIPALAVDTELWADTVWVADSSMDLEGLEGLEGFTLAARIEANRRTVMPPVTPPSSADSPRPSGGRPGPSVPGGVGSRLERRPERRLAAR